MNYVITTDNVDLINILSREYNDYNWFEAYDESYNSNIEYSKQQLLENKNSSLPAYARTSQIVKIESFIKSGAPSKLLFSINLKDSSEMNAEFAEKQRKIGGRVIIETLYNDISVFVDAETGYYSASKICLATGRSMRHLRENQDYEAYKQAVSLGAGIPAPELERVFEGMPSGFQGVWVHPLLVNHVCEWANKLYAVKVSMLMNEIARQAIVMKTTLEERLHQEERKTNSLEQDLKNERQEHNELKEMYDTLINQHAEAMEELRLTRREIQNGNAKIDLLSNQMTENHDDIHHLELASQHLAELVINQNSTNHSTGTIEFKLYLYTSHLIPRNNHRRNELNADELWLGCACGEKRYVKPRMPVDAHVVYKRKINSRDVYSYITENSNDFILGTNYRHMKIRIDEIDEFFNHIDDILAEQGEHESVRDLDEIHNQIEQRHHQEQIQAQVQALANAQNAENEALANRQQELLTQYDDLHFILNNWKRKVYREANNEGYEVWYIRYGAGGTQRRKLTRNEILNGCFTNQHDARIRYE